jgi:hypothetical protein
MYTVIHQWTSILTERHIRFDSILAEGYIVLHGTKDFIHLANLRLILQVDGSIEVWHLLNITLTDQVSFTGMNTMTHL